jgi:uncharacterized membrane protein
MRGWFGPLVTLAVTGVVAHFAVLVAAPGVIMNTALDTLEGRGIAQHAFTTPVRITPQSQAVVRSSPDLFYSLCRYDLSDSDPFSPKLLVTMAGWPDYQSLSFFDDQTNNFVTIRGSEEATNVSVYLPNAPEVVVKDDPSAVVSPTPRGVVLIRRLAPSQESYQRAAALASQDSCSKTTVCIGEGCPNAG